MAQVIGKTNLNLHELADHAGLSYGYMRRIVNGTVVPNRVALRQICNAFDLDFAEMWKNTRDGAPTGLADMAQATSMAAQIPYMFDAADSGGSDGHVREAAQVFLASSPELRETVEKAFRERLLAVYDVADFVTKIEILRYAELAVMEKTNGPDGDPEEEASISKD